MFEEIANFLGECFESLEVLVVGEQVSGEGGRCVHLNGNWSSVCREEWKGGFGSRGWVGAREEVNAFEIIVVIKEDDERGCMGVKVGGCCSGHLLRVLGFICLFVESLV